MITEAEFMQIPKQRRFALVRWAFGGPVPQEVEAEFAAQYDRWRLRTWLERREDRTRIMPQRWTDQVGEG